jgi:ABC-type transport system involved in multi-copper enzyme maturation permease subunit
MTLAYQAKRTEGGPLTQTSALFLDAYRDLNARKLFWITLLLSLLVVGIFAFIGIDEKGLILFGFAIPLPINTTFIPEKEFYKAIFTALAIPWWLGWIASILALISVGGVFPDLITGGSIDLYLSRPMSRLRLFMTKYVASLLFVALQVFVFSLGCILVIGVKSGLWEFRILLAVPLVTLMFSYIYSVCVLLGLLTRSTLASLLITLLFWLGIFGVNVADGILLSNAVAAEIKVERSDEQVAFYDRMFADNAALPPEKQSNETALRFQRDNLASRRAELVSDAENLNGWSRLFFRIKTVLPKTAETVELLSTWLVDEEGFMRASEEMYNEREGRRSARRGPTTASAPEPPRVSEDDPEVMRRLAARAESQRTPAWILGTSLAFEAVVLTLAAWIFCRRDF